MLIPSTSLEEEPDFNNLSSGSLLDPVQPGKKNLQQEAPGLGLSFVALLQQPACESMPMELELPAGTNASQELSLPKRKHWETQTILPLPITQQHQLDQRPIKKPRRAVPCTASHRRVAKTAAPQRTTLPALMARATNANRHTGCYQHPAITPDNYVGPGNVAQDPISSPLPTSNHTAAPFSRALPISPPICGLEQASPVLFKQLLQCFQHRPRTAACPTSTGDGASHGQSCQLEAAKHGQNASWSHACQLQLQQQQQQMSPACAAACSSNTVTPSGPGRKPSGGLALPPSNVQEEAASLSDEEQWMSILEARPEPDRHRQDNLNIADSPKLYDPDIDDFGLEEPSSPSLSSLLDAIDTIPGLQSQACPDGKSQQTAHPTCPVPSATAATAPAPTATPSVQEPESDVFSPVPPATAVTSPTSTATPSLQEPEFDVFNLNSIPDLDMDRLNESTWTEKSAHVGGQDAPRLLRPACNFSSNCNLSGTCNAPPQAQQPTKEKGLPAIPKPDTWDQLMKQPNPRRPKKKSKRKPLLGFRKGAANPLPVIPESDLDGLDLNGIFDNSPTTIDLTIETLQAPTGRPGRASPGHKTNAQVAGLQLMQPECAHGGALEQGLHKAIPSTLQQKATLSRFQRSNAHGSPASDAPYQGLDTYVSNQRQLYKGFVGGLGVEDNGEPMKLRTNALVRDKSSVPAAFDVKGALPVSSARAQQLMDNATSSWGMTGLQHKCRLQLVDKDNKQQDCRLRQLAAEGLVLLAEGYQFVQMEKGLDIREQGSWALVPCIDKDNRPCLKVYTMPWQEDKGFFEVRLCDLPVQPPKDTAPSTSAPYPMVF